MFASYLWAFEVIVTDPNGVTAPPLRALGSVIAGLTRNLVILRAVAMAVRAGGVTLRCQLALGCGQKR